MNKHHPPSNIIEKKLEQLPIANADQLWNDMHSILDEKMPQKKERRRFIVWWFFSGKGILILSFIMLTIAASTLFFLSTKKNSVVENKSLPASQQPDKIMKDGDSKISEGINEYIKDSNDSYSNQKTTDKIPVTPPTISAVDLTINKIVTNEQAEKISRKQKGNISEKYVTNEQFDQPVSAVSGSGEKSGITTLYLESIHQNILVTTKLDEKRSVDPQLKPGADKEIRIDKPSNNEKGFYAGIISGVDLSSIHFKNVRTGANKGFIIGYAINNRFSIESGLLWDTKRVFDDGKYFNPPGYTPVSGIKIVAVNGKNRLYELPLNIKYNITSGKHNLFATTGLSSYLMRSENYNYEYTQNGQPGGHNYISYKNKSKDWLSVANFSLGYTHKFGGTGSIRIEPYLKIPIKNIGAGDMPITSTGLNIGFIKKLR